MKINFSKKIIVILLILTPFFSFASTCSKSGYTIFTINGIMTDEQGAVSNRDVLQRKLDRQFNNQPVIVKYLYNPSHAGGVADVIDVLYQGLTNEQSNYDSIEIWSDASAKLDTQKVLLVGHSQGNFYANSLYNDVAGKGGGVPTRSIGVYSVASPASYVAGAGAYITSSSDRVISGVASRALGGKVLPSNTNIVLNKGDEPLGHSFSDIYMKYKGQEIVDGMRDSLNKLQDNTTQNENTLCITPPKKDLAHTLEGVSLALADTGAHVVSTTTRYAYNFGNTILTAFDNASDRFNKFFGDLASFVPNLQEANMASVVPIEGDRVLDVEVVQATDDSKGTQSDIKSDKEKEVVKVAQEPKIKEESKDKINTDKKESLIPEVTLPSLFVLASGGLRGMSPNTNIIEEVATIVEKEIAKITPDETPPVITLVGASPYYIVFRTGYVEEGAVATDGIDGEVPVTIEGTVDDQTLGTYTLTYTATDTKGNTTSVDRIVKVVPLLYRDSDFGLHADGNDWQMWHFNGSQIYDWNNSYIDGHLHQQFKFYVPRSSGYCGLCLTFGIFDVNPYEGYDMSQVRIPPMDDNKQNHSTGYTYDVSFTWSDSGYTRVWEHDGVVDSTTYTEVDNANNKYVGFTMSSSPFRDYILNGYIGPQRSEFFNTNGAMYMTTHAMPTYKEPTVEDNLYFNKKGEYVKGVYPSIGRSNLTEFVFKIHSSIGTPTLHIDDRDVAMALDHDDVYTTDKMKFTKGNYDYYFKVGEEKSHTNQLIVALSQYVFGDKYTFGIDELDRLWSAWEFNGSTIYDWSNTYVDGYLHQSWRVNSHPGYYCNSCLQRGIFTHDPTYGFEGGDVKVSNLEWNSQERGIVDIQWDSTGYTATLTQDGIEKYSIHTDVDDTDSIYVAWDNSFNNFREFPSGNFYGDIDMGNGEKLSGGANILVLPKKVKE